MAMYVCLFVYVLLCNIVFNAVGKNGGKVSSLSYFQYTLPTLLHNE